MGKRERRVYLQAILMLSTKWSSGETNDPERVLRGLRLRTQVRDSFTESKNKAIHFTHKALAPNRKYPAKLLLEPLKRIWFTSDAKRQKKYRDGAKFIKK